MPTSRLSWNVLFGTIPDRLSMIGSDGKGLRKGRFTSQAMQLMLHADGIDHRIWARQAQNKEAWAVLARQEKKEEEPNDEVVANNAQDISELKCPICGHRAADAKGLSRHINSKHPAGEQVIFKCSECDKTYCREWALKQHLAKEHGKQVEPQFLEEKPKNHQCKYCGKVFALKGTCGHHERKDCLGRPDSGAVWHEDRWVLICPHCPRNMPRAKRAFESTRALALHRRQKHDRPP